MIECVSMKEEHTSASRLLKEFAAHGSQAAFGELVRSHADLVYSVCWRVLGERAAAEDAAQATFLVLFQKAPTLAPDTVLASWLYRVAELSAKKIRCAQQRRARHERQAMVREQTTERFTEEWEDVRPHLDAALAALPAAQRDVLILRYIQGFTRAELAQTLTCAEETVHKRLSRGLENLRGRLRRAGVFVPLVALTAFLSERAVEAAPQELAAGITRACLVKAASPVASAVAKHVAAKLFWTPFKTILLAAMVAAAVVLPATHMALRQDPTAGNSPPESTRPAAESSIDLEAAKPKETEDDGLHLDDATRWHVTGDLPVTIERERVLFNADEALGKVFQEPGRVYRRNMQSLMHWEMGRR